MFLASAYDALRDVPTIGIVSGLIIATVLIVLGIVAWTANQKGYRNGFFDAFWKKDESTDSVSKLDKKVSTAKPRKSKVGTTKPTVSQVFRQHAKM